jgi:hypothetical protein
MGNAERDRLAEAARRDRHWRRWGPYLAERQWGTVREDYSATGDPWRHLTHDMARSYAYRWGEDGIAGISDNHQRLCLALALWNGRDPYLKERLFGLTNPEGNHGEDVKEYYWYQDATPTHSYMRFLYRYPQEAFPYEVLRIENAARGRDVPEFELADTGIFDAGAWFDVTVEHAKADPGDILTRITVRNNGAEPAPIHVLPMLWFRNDWTWNDGERPAITLAKGPCVRAEHPTLGTCHFVASDDPEWMFTENDTNTQRLLGIPNETPFVKDAFHRYIVNDEKEAVRPDTGTRCAAHWFRTLKPGEETVFLLRLAESDVPPALDPAEATALFVTRRAEADDFYNDIFPAELSADRRAIARQALAGMLWTKQWYHFVVNQWVEGDSAMPKPPPDRGVIRNGAWRHLYSDDVLSMPDKWEFPWFAVWDSAFHTVPLAVVDPEYAKSQITKFTREWYMHPNGQLPAYEWDFDDVNPPVHAWAAWQVYETDRGGRPLGDTAFLEGVFHKLLLNFTWWVNRKDANGDNIFQGGFLGMDNIGVFDRSAPLPVAASLEQSDSTSWMAMYSLNMLRIAWELSKVNPAYEDIASKFFEHFLYIADAINHVGGRGQSLWDERDGFFYDQLLHRDGRLEPLRIRSLVGLIPLLAVEIIDHGQMKRLPSFERRMNWFYDNRTDLTSSITCVFETGRAGRCLLSLMDPGHLRRLLAVMLDEAEFLSPHGIRSLSRWHADHPYVFEAEGYARSIGYEPAESCSDLFGGNSNWRGPVWFPVNHLIIGALRRYHTFYGDAFKVECPTGSGVQMTLGQVADDLSARLVGIFENRDGRRAAFGDAPLWQQPEWRDLLLFHEYFHGDDGHGLGASHQTGWTGLVANLILDAAR